MSASRHSPRGHYAMKTPDRPTMSLLRLPTTTSKDSAWIQGSNPTPTEFLKMLDVFTMGPPSLVLDMLKGARYTINHKNVFNLIKLNCIGSERQAKQNWNVIKTWAIPDNVGKATFRKIMVDLILRPWMEVACHGNISPYLGLYCEAPNSLDNEEFIPGIVVPFHESVMVFLERQNATASVLPILMDVARALAHMHSFNPSIVHGKVKGANVLISQSPLKALLTDIGLINLPFNLELEEGRWMAPELISVLLANHLPAQSGESREWSTKTYPITPASDVYSFAMMAIEMITREKPFAKIKDMSHNIELLKYIRDRRDLYSKGLDVPVISKSLERILKGCLAYDPSDRPEMASVLERLGEICHPDLESEPLELVTEDPMAEDGEDLFSEETFPCICGKKGCRM